MAIKLSALYETTNKKDIKLVAGKNGLDNVVRWAHMIEGIEISTFLEGQELSFVTGIALEKEEGLFELVKHTYYNHASGMVINIGPYIKSIPEEVLEFCNEHNFPLFEIPWHVYMANFIKSFCYQITISDRTNIELSAAIKNAIFLPEQENSYIPQLEMQNFNSEWPYCIALISILEKSTQKIVDEKRRSKFLKQIENMVTYSYERTFVLEIEGRFVLLFAQYSEKEIRDIIEKINKKFMELLKKEENIYLSIGENTQNIKCLEKSYRKAMNILKLQNRRGKNGEIGVYSNLGLYKLLLSLEDKEVIKEYYCETLGPLVKHDELNGTDYILVLDTYLKHSGSVKEVALQLFYHRNTINYKLAKIQEILSCDLSQLNTRVIYSVALMLRDIV
ncbi:PucR family transcriptional regulator ligand-binding domain-containing protein [uncultured Ilyobacter sp.]|uniref:PucR family transcriptional regulator n=1 Tax=uncultured Ilyobacter sp. TaxID=544433 RepID=UPI0029C7837D|nr:PucR family transcriptional regulator ligand-binding domain-containing protein [uncultured Ilyobacter sp.]